MEADELDVAVNSLALIEALADTMPDYYAGQLLRGQRPEGGAMPTNKKGQPLGLGSGTVATSWWATTPSGTPELATFSTGPYQEGGHFYAVRALVERGSSPVSSEGKAGALIDQLVQAAADRAVGL